MKSDYKILKLRSGEEIITRIVGSKKNTLIIERPFIFRVSMMMDHRGQRREITILRNWIQNSNEIKTSIPKDHIVNFQTPDDKTVQLYTLEMEREDTQPDNVEFTIRDPNADMMDDDEAKEKISDLLASIQNNLQEQEEEDKPKDNSKDYVLFNMMFPPSILKDMIARGIIDDEDIVEALADEMKLSDIYPEIEDNGEGLSDEYNPAGDGSDWTHFSPNPLDYLKDDEED